MDNNIISLLNEKLDRIANILDENFSTNKKQNDITSADAFVWQPETSWLQPVPQVNRVEIDLLKGIDRVRDILIENTERFANGFSANNSLLWGARGMGKSSLVKAAHASILKKNPESHLKLIEIHREDIADLPFLMAFFLCAKEFLI